MNKESFKKKCVRIKPIKSIDFSKSSFRNWDYINSPYKSTTKINGKSKKKENYYNSKNIIELHPNTKRTLNPEYAPANIFKPPKKEVNNIRIFSEEKKLFQSKKRVKIIKSNLNLNNSKGKLCTKFRDKKFSQIENIPGPDNVKTKNINDDIIKTKNKINSRNKNGNFIKKIQEDFSSNITCLPNSLNNKNFKEIKRGKTYNNFKTNNINNDMNIKRYKNQESNIDFYMLKPSSFFDLKYKLRNNFI